MAGGLHLTQLFKLLRASHPKFQYLGSQDEDIVRVLNSLSNVVDALNTIRNHASVAHPNENLLDEAEAMLMLNVTRTLFHYLNAKVQKVNDPCRLDAPALPVAPARFSESPRVGGGESVTNVS